MFPIVIETTDLQQQLRVLNWGKSRMDLMALIGPEDEKDDDYASFEIWQNTAKATTIATILSESIKIYMERKEINYES